MDCEVNGYGDFETLKSPESSDYGPEVPTPVANADPTEKAHPVSRQLL